jgi:hypothetical protein
MKISAQTDHSKWEIFSEGGVPLIDELRNRLRSLHIFVPHDVESDQMQRRRNPFTQQQNLLNLKVCFFQIKLNYLFTNFI